jgi:hypothetical protein
MGTKRVLEARLSLAAQSELRHDQENAEAEAIYFTALRGLVFCAKTIRRTYGAQAKVCATVHGTCGAQTEVCATNRTAGRAKTRRLISMTAAGA